MIEHEEDSTAPSYAARRELGARARGTLADIMRTHENVMGSTPLESAEWLKQQVDRVASLRTKDTGEGK